MQVKPTDVDKWSKVEFVSDGSPIPTSYIVVYIFADEKFAARISNFTADACIPRPCKYLLVCSFLTAKISGCLCFLHVHVCLFLNFFPQYPYEIINFQRPIFIVEWITLCKIWKIHMVITAA